ncbi:LOW QUALITY PROTEIN: hypothetical protein Cgig2_019550 [Carnegiea gigantea]|uniref:Uncharacterized protein n=1 Tax=Carnegiea gigantea TaxID=171969 RepID=A0A9Q1QI19_9CARY|nr:LOW QUALITY PROTEIN: hypothetical protein Cgig2_019550 [Carnegiea gigantea]
MVAKDRGSISHLRYHSPSGHSFLWLFLILTNKMAQCVAYHFEWDQCGVAFSPLPLANDFQALCPSFELVVAEKAAQYFQLPELPQVIFYTMLLSEAERLGVWQNGARVLEARFQEDAKQEEGSSNAERATSPSDNDKERKNELGSPPFVMAFLPLHDTREMADFVRESFRWHWMTATRPPRPLPDDYRDLCLRFMLSDVKRAALDFELPEMVQATFYPMLLNDVVELGRVRSILG